MRNTNRQIILATGLGASVLTTAAHGQAANIESLCADVLRLAGLSTETARFDPNILRFYSFDEFTLPSFRSIEADPWRCPYYLGTLRSALKAQAGPDGLLLATRGFTGEAVRRDLLGDPTAKWVTASEAADAFELSIKALGVDVRVPSTVPATTRRAAAIVLLAVSGTSNLIERSLPAAHDRRAEYERQRKGALEGAGFLHQLDLLRAFNLRSMYAGAYDLMRAVRTAASIAEQTDPSDRYEFFFETPRGKVLLRGAGNHSTPPGDYLLIIDTGGDDTYASGGRNSSPNCTVSIIIDTRGNDKYVSDNALSNQSVASFEARKSADWSPGPGGALLGIALITDLSGNDVYRSTLPSMGSGRFGVGAIHDLAGNDIYDSYRDSQGFGYAGAGILFDVAGNDRYDCFTQSQGCGLTRGIGMLVDKEGDDQYVANDTAIDFPSPQSAEHNVSMSQGAGFGRRADFSDGHSLGGGLGVLCDVEGDDVYRCAVFGQGVGYWQGIGALFDEAGDDSYFGLWYVQGASAHFAVGYLEDSGGEDSYTATMNMAQGAGHDFSIGYLLDRSGNDRYTAPNLSLGAGNANGIGLFIDLAGNDSYRSTGTTLGKANPSDPGGLREFALCLGLFLDFAGEDEYPSGAEWAKNRHNSVNYSKRSEVPHRSQLGIFSDQ